MSTLKQLEDRAYKTYKSRLMAAQRLSRLNAAWNAALVSSAAAGAVAAIGTVVDPTMYGLAGPALLAVSTVIALVVSLVVAAQGFGARSRNMFVSYRKAQRISVVAEALGSNGKRPPGRRVAQLWQTYNNLLDESENHSDADFERVSKPGVPTRAKIQSSALGALPFVFLTLPLLTVAPFVVWAFRSVVA